MNRALPWTDEEKRLPKLSNSPEKRGRKQKEEDQAEDNLSPRPIRDEDTDSQRKMVQRGKGPGEPSSLPKPSFLPPIGRQVHRL